MDTYDKVIDLAKRRGFLWNSFELYGGAAGFFDYGPNGCTVKRHIEDTWRKFYVVREGYMEIECPTVGIEDIFIASGHVGGFSDPLCECLSCHQAFRADHLVEGAGIENAGGYSLKELDDAVLKFGIKCPECGGDLAPAYEFNLMFKTTIGPGNGRQGYMRPETAQGMFVDFQRLSRYYRDKLPFGACQIGKSYRNEISPRQGVLRLREFTQAECEIFVDPSKKTHPRFDRYAGTLLTLYPQAQQEDPEGKPIQMKVSDAVRDGIIAHEFLAYYVSLTNEFLQKVGIRGDRLRFRQHMKDEMAHYAADCWDAEVLTDRFGWVEVVGIADRTTYDLKAHAAQSKIELSVYVEYPEPKFVTSFVVKPDMGKLGPLFKGKAKLIGDTLKEMTHDQIEAAVKDGMIMITVDGAPVEVPHDIITYGEETVKVSGETIIPHVIEPSYGIDRITYCVLEHAFEEESLSGSAEDADDEEAEGRTVLHLKGAIAPFQVSVLPLMGKPQLSAVATEIHDNFVHAGIMADYDEAGTIGKRYRRNDEIGIPYSVTVDFDTLEDKTVTIRDRDSMKQIRAPVSRLNDIIRDLIDGNARFEDF
ncbi:MAG: glycine--tRNA ligase [Methanosarcinaceae archaeon]|nr:glycine--tRNA ligase [Methanosarcinaceae archaeon]